MEGTASETWRLAVLTSGHSRGSNLRALHNYFSLRDKSVRIAFVTVSLPSAPVVDVCGVACKSIISLPGIWVLLKSGSWNFAGMRRLT